MSRCIVTLSTVVAIYHLQMSLGLHRSQGLEVSTHLYRGVRVYDSYIRARATTMSWRGSAFYVRSGLID